MDSTAHLWVETRGKWEEDLLSESTSHAPVSPELCAFGSPVFPVLRKAFTEGQWCLGPSKRHSEEETTITQWWGKDITSSIAVFRTPVHICLSAEEHWLEWEDSKHYLPPLQYRHIEIRSLKWSLSQDHRTQTAFPNLVLLTVGQ